jgi:hypothetical protein
VNCRDKCNKESISVNQHDRGQWTTLHRRRQSVTKLRVEKIVNCRVVIIFLVACVSCGL